MSFDAQKLYSLLPAVYQIRDQAMAQNGHAPLQDLMALLAGQIALVEEDLAQLYDDQFIETCAPWVVPYIGDLIRYQMLQGSAPNVTSPRAEVAHTIGYRRRKGTVFVLEQLARDVTGLSAHAVEFFKYLGWTQYMKHTRLECSYSPDLRDWRKLEKIGTAFDTVSHTIDVRSISEGRGLYNIPNIGLFLWRLHAYPATNAPLTPGAQPWQFRFSSLGNDIPLFNNPPTANSLTQLVTPIDVPDPIRRRDMWAGIKGVKAGYTGPGLTNYYGGSRNSNGTSDASVLLTNVDGPIDISQIQICNLGDESANWKKQPSTGNYLIDPELGRLAISTQVSPVQKSGLLASYYYGFSAEMGGGQYERESTFAVTPGAANSFYIAVNSISIPGQLSASGSVSTVTAALNALNSALAANPSLQGGVVEIIDNGIYSENLPSINIGNGQTVELRAADGCRPTLVLKGSLIVTGSENSIFSLNGLLVSYVYPLSNGSLPATSALLEVPGGSNQLSGLNLTHCTLVPGGSLSTSGQPQEPTQPSLIVGQVVGLAVIIQSSIVGPIYINNDVSVGIKDSIVDATSQTNMAYAANDGLSGGGPLSLDSVTVIGNVHAQILQLVSDSLMLAQNQPVISPLPPGTNPPPPVVADRLQEGCVRFTYLPANSKAPKRYECQPPTADGDNCNCDQASADSPSGSGGTPVPVMTSLLYGTPGYCQMDASTVDAIRRGADDEGEMGAFHHLYLPQVETNLLTRLQEYMRAGLQAGIFYET